MNRRKICFLFFAAALSALLLLVGCSGTAAENEPAAGETEETGGEAVDAGALSEEEKIVTALVASEIRPDITDTIYMDVTDFRIFELVYDPLVRYGYRGEILPALAENWSISEDGKEYTFYLRKDIKFSDGTDFNADNVLFNASRWENNKTFSAELIDVEKVDDYTVTFVFSEVAYPCLIEFTYPRPYRMLSENALDAEGNFVEMVGTGQWMVESYESNKEVILVPNPYYYGEIPKIDKLILQRVEDGQTRTMAMQSGEADISLADLPSENQNIIETDENLAVLETNVTQTFFLMLNYENQHLQNQKVRQALNYAVDRQGLVNNLLNGQGEPARGLLTPNTPYVTEENSPGYSYDPEKAKALLAEAGYQDSDGDGIVEKNGEKLSLGLMFHIEEYANWKTICEFLQSEFSKVGVEVILNQVESAKYYDAIWSTRDYDMLIYWTYEDSWNPHGFLSGMFYQTEGNPAVCWYDQQISEQIGQVLKTIDEAQRVQLYDSIFSLMNELAVTVPLYYPPRAYVYNTRLTGIEEAPTSYEAIYWGRVDIQ